MDFLLLMSKRGLTVTQQIVVPSPSTICSCAPGSHTRSLLCFRTASLIVFTNLMITETVGPGIPIPLHAHKLSEDGHELGQCSILRLLGGEIVKRTFPFIGVVRRIMHLTDSAHSRQKFMVTGVARNTPVHHPKEGSAVQLVFVTCHREQDIQFIEAIWRVKPGRRNAEDYQRGLAESGCIYFLPSWVQIFRSWLHHICARKPLQIEPIEIDVPSTFLCGPKQN